VSVCDAGGILRHIAEGEQRRMPLIPLAGRGPEAKARSKRKKWLRIQRWPLRMLQN